MDDFNFDPNLPPDENIKIFFEHLKTLDNKMAQILENKVKKLIPLPDSGTRRSSIRQSVNSEILQLLESKEKREDKM
jgi:hypothetical protein